MTNELAISPASAIIGINGAAAQTDLAVAAISGGLKTFRRNRAQRIQLQHRKLTTHFTCKSGESQAKELSSRQEAEVGLAEERRGESVAGDEAGGEARLLDDRGGERVVATGHQDGALILYQPVHARLPRHPDRRIGRPPPEPRPKRGVVEWQAGPVSRHNRRRHFRITGWSEEVGAKELFFVSERNTRQRV